MRNYEERAKDFIQEIYPYLESRTISATIRGVAKFNFEHHRKVVVKHGIARTALITSDYVIKFDTQNGQADRFGGCEDEIEFYNRAEQDGFGYLFAKVTKYTYNHYNFYIMPRIHGIGKYQYKDAWDFMTNKEYSWCYNNDLYDLHCYNYGFRDGHVCIIDYGAHD